MPPEDDLGGGPSDAGDFVEDAGADAPLETGGEPDDAGADANTDAGLDAAPDADDEPWLDAGDDADIDDGGAGGMGGAGGGDIGDGGRGGSGGQGDDDAGPDEDAGDGDAGDGGDEGDGDAGQEPPRILGLLDLCSADEDCDGSFLCRPMFVGGPKRCTKACTGSAECMMGTRCENIGAERYCAQTDIGRPCGSDAECNASCLQSQGYCTSQCSSGFDCPNGFGCTHVNGIKTCVKVAIYCDGNDPGAGSCAPNAAACDVGSNLVVQSCTTRCQSDADCPQRATGLAAWRCNTGDNYCDRPSDVFGPIPGGQRAEYACQFWGDINSPVRNLCNDGLQTNIDAWQPISGPGVNCFANETTPGNPGDSCIDSCRYQGGCGHGFYCSALSSLGGATRIGVCLPTGHGEIGDACTKHRDCAFGYCDLVNNKCSRDCSADGICPSESTCTVTGDYVDGTAFKRCE